MNKYFLTLITFLFSTFFIFGNTLEYELSIEDLQETSLVSLEIPVEALISLGGRAEALRLYDCDSRIVPWVRQQKMSSKFITQRQISPSKGLLLKKLDNGAVELHFELNEKAKQPNLLQIDTAMKDFAQKIEISGWIDDEWQVLLEDGFIFDGSELLYLRNTVLDFDSKKARKFRIIISAAELKRHSALQQVKQSWDNTGFEKGSTSGSLLTEAFKMHNVSFWHTYQAKVDNEPYWLYWESEDFSYKVLAGQKSSLLELEAPCFPVNGIKINAEENNYSRNYTLRVQAPGTLADELQAQGNINQIKLADWQRTENEIIFPAIQEGKIKITFNDADNPPLTIKSVSYKFPAYKLYFFAEKSKAPYKLSAVRETREPLYDTAAIIKQALTKTDGKKASLLQGKGKTIALQKTKEKNFPKVYLYIIIGLAIVVLGYAMKIAAGKTSEE